MTKIIRATVENFKRIEVLEITPNGDVVEINGRNEQGKSSLIDAIEAALGGKSRSPAEPIRRGAERASVVLETDDFTVERVWTTKSDRLVVKNRDGASFPKAQTKLDADITNLSFDPLEFMSLTPKQQREQLLKLCGITGLDELDAQKQADYNLRREVNRDLTRERAVLAQMQQPEDHWPQSIISKDDIESKLRELRAVEREYQTLDARCCSLSRTLFDLEKQVAAVRSQLSEAKATLAAMEKPDTDALLSTLSDIDTSNELARARELYCKQTEIVTKHEKSADTLTERLANYDQRKTKLLESASLPVPGLGFGDEGVTFEGVPLQQAAMSRKIRVCTAIAAAANPELRIALVRHGNDLDSESMSEFYEACREAGLQAWIERIVPSTSGTVVIEDGRIAQGDSK